MSKDLSKHQLKVLEFLYTNPDYKITYTEGERLNAKVVNSKGIVAHSIKRPTLEHLFDSGFLNQGVGFSFILDREKYEDKYKRRGYRR